MIRDKFPFFLSLSLEKNRDAMAARARSMNTCAHPKAAAHGNKSMKGLSTGRRGLFGLGSGSLALTVPTSPACPRTNRLRPSEECFRKLDDFEWRGSTHVGLMACELREGKGQPLEPGQRRPVQVHFDVRYGPVVVSSSRRGRLLGENRSIAEPVSFEYGEVPERARKSPRKKEVTGIGIEVKYDPSTREYYVQSVAPRSPAYRAGVQRGDLLVAVGKDKAQDLELEGIAKRLQGKEGEEARLTLKRGGSDQYSLTLAKEVYAVRTKRRTEAEEGGGGGGLYAGSSDQEAPAVLFIPEALEGMRKGGLRLLRVPPELGYEGEGFGELPPDNPFFLEVELLSA